MNVMAIIGIAIGGATTVIDRLLCRLPNRLAVVLYALADFLIIAGMIISRQSA